MSSASVFFAFSCALAHEWPVAQAAVAPVCVLLVGELGLYSNLSAERAAIGVGLFALGGWGWFVARRDQMSPWRAAVVALGSLSLGVIVILVKLSVH